MTITMDQPRSRRLTEQTAATAYRPNVRPKGYRGRRRAPGLLSGLWLVADRTRAANPVWTLGMVAGALWTAAAILADQMGIFGSVLGLLPW